MFERRDDTAMKKLYFIIISVIILSSLILGGCGETSSTTPASTVPTTAKPAPTSSAPAASTTLTTVPSPTAPPPAPAGTQRYGGTLVIVCDESIDALGYPAEASPKAFLYYKNALPVMETLVNADNMENITPGLAKSWDISPDGKTITLHLQENVKFHDGTDFNAEAVKYNLQAWDLTNAPFLANVTAMDVINDYTLKLTLQKFDSHLLLRFASGSVGQIASPTAMKKAATPETMAKEHMVGTGPFKFVSWKRQDYVKFVKNPDYWQKGKPYLDAIEFRFVADYMTRQLSFKAGEADYTGALYPVDAHILEGEGYRIEPSELTFVWYFVPDSANPDSPFSNVKVREALEYAIDKKTIAQGIGEGYMAPAYQFAQPNAPYFTKNAIERVYDPQKAKDLLTEAGYPNGFSTTIITDIRVKMDLVTAVRTYLKAVGINCDLDVADVPRSMSVNYGGWKNAIYWQGYPSGATQLGLTMTFGSRGPLVSMLRPEGWQDQWDAMVAEPNEAKRLAMWKEMNAKTIDLDIVIPLIYDHRIYAAQKKVRDLGWAYGQNALWWDPANAWLEE
jgi:peptide/nickel transport system substrate-binding protein